MTRVLIVDDDAVLRTMYRVMLERVGYEVVEAANGREAVHREQAMPLDVILLDILMPDQDGLETIRILRRIDPQVKIIAMSGGGQTRQMNVLRMAAMLGAQHTLRKPFPLHALREAIRDLMGGADEGIPPAP